METTLTLKKETIHRLGTTRPALKQDQDASRGANNLGNHGEQSIHLTITILTTL